MSLRHAAASLVLALGRVRCPRPVWMLGIWLMLLGIAFGGLFRVRIETSGDSILDKSAPEWAFYQAQPGEVWQ